MCPATCDTWCATRDCDVPAGCENPGCRCLQPSCDARVCPSTCGDYCEQANACTLPEGCENPGCGCPIREC